MRKKLLVFLAFCALSLSACSYNPFNDFTGINPFDAGNLEMVQCYDTLVWEKNEKCSGYSVYVYPDESTKTDELSPVATTSDTFVKLNSSWVGMKVKVIGYTYENTTSILNIKKKTVCQSSKMKITTTSASNIERMSYTASDMTSLLTNKTAKYGIVDIPKTINRLALSDFTSDYNFHFRFESRPTNEPVTIVLSNCNITGYKGVGLPVFSYTGTNNVNFMFLLFGTNTIDGGTTLDSSTNARTAIDLPTVCFYHNDEGGNIQVTGGTCYGNNAATGKATAGYAISAKRVINILPDQRVKLIGGRGADGKTNLVCGGDGQLPMKTGVKVLSANLASIGLQAGDGGNGATGGTGANGGNAYSYTYMVNKAYKKYKDCFYKIKEATPGSGTGYGTKGKLITEKS